MEDTEENFSKKKKLLMRINSGELNKKLLYYINEARTSPKDFSRHLMINDDVDEKISKLSLFFKYSSIEVPPLIVNPNLEKCSQELIYHILSIDEDSFSLKFTQEEKEKNCLKERLKAFNLIPGYYIDLLVVGDNNPKEALTNVLINKAHRKKILNPEMRYIGISSGLLPSERLCFVIDIVSSFKIYNRFLNQKLKNCNYKIGKIKYNCNTYKNYQEDEKLIYNNNEEEIYINKKNNNSNYNNNEMINNEFNPNYNSEVKNYIAKGIFKSLCQTPFKKINKSQYHYKDNKYKNYNNTNKRDKIIILSLLLVLL